MNKNQTVSIEAINNALCAYKSSTYQAEDNGEFIRIYRLDSDFVTVSMTKYIACEFHLKFIGCGCDEKGTYALFVIKENDD